MRCQMAVSLFTAWLVASSATAVADLVGYWKLNGNANDVSDFDNDGTIMGATSTSGFDGVSNGGYLFQGANSGDQISIPNSPSLAIGGDMTVAAWVRFNGLSGAIISRYNSALDHNDWILSAGPELELDVYPTGSFFDPISGARTDSGGLITGQWYHVAAIFDSEMGGSSIKLYIDGVEAAVETIGNEISLFATK